MTSCMRSRTRRPSCRQLRRLMPWAMGRRMRLPLAAAAAAAAAVSLRAVAAEDAGHAGAACGDFVRCGGKVSTPTPAAPESTGHRAAAAAFCPASGPTWYDVKSRRHRPRNAADGAPQRRGTWTAPARGGSDAQRSTRACCAHCSVGGHCRHRRMRAAYRCRRGAVRPRGGVWNMHVHVRAAPSACDPRRYAVAFFTRMRGEAQKRTC